MKMLPKHGYFVVAAALLGLPTLVQAADKSPISTQEVFQRMALARQAVALDPPHNALLNSPLASHPMFKQVFASIDEAKLNEAAAQLMAEQFSTDELRALVRFQSSPEGKSIRIKMPGYQQLLGATMQNYLSTAFQQMMVKQGGNGASNIPVDSTLASSTLPPMQLPEAAPATPLSTAAPSGAGTPLKH